MRQFSKKFAKALLLTALSAVLLSGFAAAADLPQAVGVGVTTGSALRMRSEASTESGIVTMLEKDVAVAVLDDSVEGWYEVAYNGSTGYVSADFLAIDEDNVFESYGRVTGDGVNIRAAATTESDKVTAADADTVVTVTGFKDGWFAVTCQSGREGYIRSDFLTLTNSASASSSGGGNGSIVSTAKQYLGTRYVYGGASPSGFDCSGFTMYVMKQFGYNLPHTATGQWQSGAGTRVYSISELQPGDLVFFCDPSRSNGKACSHAGIYVGNGQHIHASSSRSKGVVISDLTSGYYNTYFVGGMHLG